MSPDLFRINLILQPISKNCRMKGCLLEMGFFARLWCYPLLPCSVELASRQSRQPASQPNKRTMGVLPFPITYGSSLPGISEHGAYIL
jgi:hypothetical protein